MTLMLTVSWLLIAVAAYCGHQAFRLDRELRRLLPAVVERRWRTHPDWVRTALDPEHRFDPLVRIVLGPARWQRHLHSERGAALVDRFWLFVGLTWCLALAGVGALIAVLERGAL